MSMRTLPLVLVTALVVGSAAAPARAQEPLKYPDSRREAVTDTYFGVEVADPYRWLENDVRESSEVREWVTAQNKLTFDWLKRSPHREPLRQRLTKLWDYERRSLPGRAGERRFWTRNDGRMNQSVLMMEPGPGQEPVVLIDPNTWSKDGTVALSGTYPSPDGRYLTYGKSKAGSDWKTWHILDLETRQLVDAPIEWIKFSGVAWTADAAGFFYACYEAPAEGENFQSLNFGQRLMYHELGTPSSDDLLVYERQDKPAWGYSPAVSPDGRWLVTAIWKGTADKYRILLKDLKRPLGMTIELVDTFDDEMSFVSSYGHTLFFKTDYDAPKGRLIAVDVRSPAKSEWREVIPESEHALRGVSAVGNVFFANYLADAKSLVRVHRRDGSHLRDVSLPENVSAGGFGGRASDTDTYYSVSGFTTPGAHYRYDILSGESERIWMPEGLAFFPDDFVTKQVFYPSKDGTQIPMFIVHKKGVKPDGKLPTLLYGYGGFNIALPPRFSPAWLGWVDRGGVFALANLRGGGEYGSAWHLAGTKTQKQNVFDDFLAAAEYLVSDGWTEPGRIAITGRSNGGLLVGAVMAQKPEAFGAALPAVGVMDMLRFQKFTAGRFWTDDYGSSEASKEEFDALYAYSPYHNMKQGTAYPPTLVTTADTDDRVVPGHSFKFAAALQHAQAGASPVLIRIETGAGHGAGKPTAKRIEEATDELAFALTAMGIPADG